LREQIKQKVVDPTWTSCRQLLRPTESLPEGDETCPLPNPLSAHTNSVREYLWRYCSQFDDFDQITFPIAYGTDVGEANVVEVIRISPEDAVNLINERREQRDSPDGTGRRKLAGTALHHFGAFLDRTWRRNDIMWGRLDGAERLITALLPDKENKDVRAALIRDAHTAILQQEMTPESRLALGQLMSEALVRANAGERLEDAIQKVVGDTEGRMATVLRNALSDKELLAFMKSGYEVNRQLDPKPMLRAISRSTQVIGKVFEDVANKNNLDGKSLAWIARLGQMFWGLIEVAVPNSLLNMLVFHWLRVLYVFEVLLIFGSFLLGARDTLRFALTALGVTVALNVIVLLLRDRMRLKNGWLYMFTTIFISAIFLFAGIGADETLNIGVRTSVTKQLRQIRARIFGPVVTVLPLSQPTPVVLPTPLASPSLAPSPMNSPSIAPTPAVTPSVAPSPVPSATVNRLPTPLSNPTPSATNPERTALISDAQSKLKRGSWAFNVPDEMTQGNNVTASARISQKDLAEIAHLLTQGLKGSGSPISETVLTGKKMRVSLTATKPEAFTIRIIGDDVKIISDRPEQPYTDWQWDVVAKESGNQELHLLASAILLLPDGSAEFMEQPVRDKTVHVKVSYGYLGGEVAKVGGQFFADKDTIKWLIAGIPTLLAAIFGFLKRNSIKRLFKKLFMKKSQGAKGKSNRRR